MADKPGSSILEEMFPSKQPVSEETGWKYPTWLPRFTSDEFEEKKRLYVKEHGYRVHIPKFDDIIHLSFEKKPTDQELKWFYKRKYDKLEPGRQKQIEEMVKKRRRRYERMLASPSPRWYRNVATVMTVIDDVEDALSTVAVIGRIAARFVPRMFGKAFLGPIGWILLAADLLNLGQMLTCLPFTMMGAKRMGDDFLALNPFSKEAKLRRARKARRWWPGIGDLLEVAQTTDQLFGVGVSLGPLVGFVADYASGTYRLARGQRVQFGSAPPQLYPHEFTAMRAFRALPIIFASDEEFSDDDKFMTILTANLMTQVIKPFSEIWNPLDHVLNLDDIELEPPRVTNPITRQIFEEDGKDPDDFVGWPTFSPDAPTFKNLSTQYAPRATDTWNKYAFRNQHNMPGWVAGNNLTEYASNMLSIIEDTLDVIEDYQDNPQAMLNALKDRYDRDKELASGALHPVELAIFMRTWKGYYLGTVQEYPKGGFREGPIEWDYEKNYDSIWNPPRWWIDKPKFTPREKISWVLEHTGTPWYIKYCQWCAVLGGNTGFGTHLWYVARALAELKIPAYINPTWAGVAGRSPRVSINFYCKKKCQMNLMPADLFKELVELPMFNQEKEKWYDLPNWIISPL